SAAGKANPFGHNALCRFLAQPCLGGPFPWARALPVATAFSPGKRSFMGRTLGALKTRMRRPYRGAAWLEGARYVLTLIRSNRPRTTWARPKPRTPDPRRRRMRLLVSSAPSVATIAPRAVTLQLVRDLFNQAPPPGPSLCCIAPAHSTPRSAARCTLTLCRQALILGFT